MVLTESTMLEIGTQAPDFSLPDVTTGENLSLNDLDKDKPLLIIFLCRHCPYVQHVKEELSRLGKDYASDLTIIGISSNDAESYPDDSPDSLAEFAREEDITFPILYDESQEVAKSYTAACTPDFFLFDQEQKLAYRGQLDSSRPGNDTPVTGVDLRSAIDAVLEGKDPSSDQNPASGCNIKWKPGNEPNYF